MSSTLFTHLQPGPEVKFVQLVLDSKLSPGDPIDESCTICGAHYEQRSSFNAHIRAHLKEKLNTRRREAEEGIEKRKNEVIELENMPFKKKPLKTSDLMAELAACTPVPPEIVAEYSSLSHLHPLAFPLTPASSLASPSNIDSIPSGPLSEYSDIEHDDIMSYEMEMNRIDFNNDISSILDQIEEDFESPGGFNELLLETPPDSDTENNKDDPLINELYHSTFEYESDLLGFDKFTKRICLPSEKNGIPEIYQYPSSIAKVGHLPPKALAVLNQLPIFKSDSSTRWVNVVKVERSGSGILSSGDIPPSGPFTTVIKIECQNSHNSQNKIIETYRAIDTGDELKLVSSSQTSDDIIIKKSNSTNTTSSSTKCITSNSSSGYSTSSNCSTSSTNSSCNSYKKPSKTCSECTVCGKTITTKNMARHMEKHTGKKKFHCDICHASFFQKTHLKNHVACHSTTLNNNNNNNNSINHSSNNNNNINVNVNNNNNNNNTEFYYNCSHCFLKFSRKSDFQRHVKGCHFDEGELLRCIEKQQQQQHQSQHPFVCRFCARPFAQKGHLNRHLRTHGSENYNCKAVDKSCKNKISFLRHRSKHLTCTQCNDNKDPPNFANKTSLQDHYLRVHSSTAILSVERTTDLFLNAAQDESKFSVSPSSSSSANAPSSLNKHTGPSEEKTSESYSSLSSPQLYSSSSLGAISNSNFFDLPLGLTEDIYSSDLFTTS